MRSPTNFIALLREYNQQLGGVTINDYELSLMVWNLFLLLVPWVCFLLIRSIWQSQGKPRFYKFYLLVLGALWLLFLPNSAYLITEVRHLVDFCPPAEFDVCVSQAWIVLFFFSYSLVVWLFFVYLVASMGELLERRWPPLLVFLYEAIIIPLSAWGVLIGLFNRFNTWEMITHPASVFKALGLYLSSWEYFINLLFFVLFYYFLYFLGKRLIINKKSNGLFKGWQGR